VTDLPGNLDGRRRVLDAIESASEPLTVDDVCAATGLHPNTVRAHLDVLLAGESIAREPAETGGRGRPRWLYRRTEPVASPFRYLVEALTTQLSASADPELADAAAERWAQAIPELPVADSPDEAVSETVDALNRLGFRAVASPVGDAIALTGCPYAALVEQTPMICEIHTALMTRLLDQTKQPVGVEAMDVWARPGMCVARLNRADLQPTRTITVSASDQFDSERTRS
jgi:predicted ArsR family transcriptional regulator